MVPRWLGERIKESGWATEHWVSPGKSWVRTRCRGTEHLVSFLAGGWSVKVTFTNFFASPPTSATLIVAGSTNWPECQLMQGIQMLTGEGMRQVSLSSSAWVLNKIILWRTSVFELDMREGRDQVQLLTKKTNLFLLADKFESILILRKSGLMSEQHFRMHDL